MNSSDCYSEIFAPTQFVLVFLNCVFLYVLSNTVCDSDVCFIYVLLDC